VIADVIPFPNCERAPVCMQSERIASLEAHKQDHQTQLDRIEKKVDGIKGLILSTALSVAGGAVVALVGVLLRQALAK
jgi:hypothetical protein